MKLLLASGMVLAAAGAWLLSRVLPRADDPVIAIAAAVETDPVPNAGDAADDPAIWVHPSDPALSLVLGDDKKGGLFVYNLDGRQVQALDTTTNINNIDVRYDFPLVGHFSDGTAHSKVDLVGAANETNSNLTFYKFHPETGHLEPAGRAGPLTFEPYGLCLYRSGRSGRFFVFASDHDGRFEQWELRDNGDGFVDGRRVRTFDVGMQSEGCVTDDATGALYIGEEDVAIWRYGAEPDAGDARSAVDHASPAGHFKADIEGLAILDTGNGRGYLLGSSQGNSTFVVYDRGNGNRYLGTFRIVDGRLDGVSSTDGIDVTSTALGTSFPKGLFVAQDGSNSNPKARQNFKFVRWDAIASGFSEPLAVAPSVDPRRTVGRP